MSMPVFEDLFGKKLISEASFEKIKVANADQRVSLHNELRAMLYLGVLLTSSGIGVLIYKHIDKLGHLVILSALITACLACYGYCFWKRPIKPGNSASGSPVFYDYLLLLGSLLLLITIGYLQSQFQAFGHRWGLASFIPMVILFATAYYFDHKGVLSLAIVNLAAWVGINISRSTFYGINELYQSETIIAGILLAVTLILLAMVVKQKGIKPHFSAVYHHFGTHGAFIAAIAGIIHFRQTYWIWLFILLAVAVFHAWKSARESSAYHMVITSLYLYAGISYLLLDRVFSKISGSDGKTYAVFFYFLITGIGMAVFMVKLNKKIKSDAGL